MSEAEWQAVAERRAQGRVAATRYEDWERSFERDLTSHDLEAGIRAVVKQAYRIGYEWGWQAGQEDVRAALSESYWVDAREWQRDVCEEQGHEHTPKCLGS